MALGIPHLDAQPIVDELRLSRECGGPLQAGVAPGVHYWKKDYIEK